MKDEPNIPSPKDGSVPVLASPPASVAENPPMTVGDFSWGPEVEPWPEAVEGAALLDQLAAVFSRYVVLPRWGEETLALWTLHTYAYALRDVTTYLGIESPEKRCGKTTLLGVLSELVNRPVVAANISPSAFFRVIEEARPTLLIDEADTFLEGNEELRGILNSGYSRKTAYVLRVANEAPKTDKLQGAGSQSNPTPHPPTGVATPARPVRSAGRASQLARYSCWCPKAMAAIGRLPETLADRCIVIRMQRKTPLEECERLKNLQVADLRQQCLRFVQDHAEAIANALPEIPGGLNDRAGDIWEPLLALADLAGGAWPETARTAALVLSGGSPEENAVGWLLWDICLTFRLGHRERIFSRDLVNELQRLGQPLWSELSHGKAITEVWLSHRLRRYGIQSRTVRIGEAVAKGYLKADFEEAFDRYIPHAEIKAILAEEQPPQPAETQGTTQG